MMTTTPAESPDEIARRRFYLRVAWLAWIVLACALSVKAVGWPDDHSVYPCFETGARLWWTGQDVYDPKVCTCDFRYGPACAVALLPMALLPSELGGLLWTWLNLAVFFLTLRALVQRFLPGTWTPRREGAFLCLVLVGVVRSLWSGQSNLLIFSLVAQGAMAIADQRWWRAALLLAAPVHIKVWPLAAAGLLVACRPRPLAVRLGGLPAGRGGDAAIDQAIRLGVAAILWLVWGCWSGRRESATSIAMPGPSGRRSTRPPKPTSP